MVRTRLAGAARGAGAHARLSRLRTTPQETTMLEKIPRALGEALSGVRPGMGETLWGDEALARLPATLRLRSDAFADDMAMPARFTADGPGTSPPLAWEGVPAATVELVLIVEDADPPLPRPLVHAIAHGLKPAADGIAEGALAADPPIVAMGKTSALRPGWLPPDPPAGHGDHRYLFQLYALSAAAALGEHPGRGAIRDAIAELGIARGLLVGRYARP